MARIPEKPQFVQYLLRHDLKQVALVAFVVGIVLHACLITAVLDDGGSSGSTSPRSPSDGTSPSVQEATPVATRLPDRTSCADIRGTDYRSDTERQWFLQNCSTARLGSPPDGLRV